MHRFPTLCRRPDDGGSGGGLPAPETAPAQIPAESVADRAAPPAQSILGNTPPPGQSADYDGLSLPDGMSVDADGLAAFKSLAAENGLSPDMAQKLVDFQAGRMAQAQKTHQTAIAQWAKDAQADREFGGADFQRNSGLASQAVRAFASPELVSLLNDTGLGNHPELIRTFWRIGKAMAEDNRITAGGPPKGDRLAALYPTMMIKD